MIYLMSVDGSDVVALTKSPKDDVLPDWSPDGSKIAFASVREENLDIYVLGTDGEGLQQVTDDPANDVWPKYSPSGNEILFFSQRDGNDEIYVLELGNGDVRRLTTILGMISVRSGHRTGDESPLHQIV